ncbi:hypothetical protein X797_001493 [Metarhizium robertsii]|uniref:Uncharacterized protein n=1 Tax=Metarhizium robertsii TaxID=568076 RepID=A0A0A1VA64_9HYPO|nr:hypothetical protein X797_001493 [Metarhizium robertsii]
MCTESYFTLKCEHVAVSLDVCARVPRGGPTQCTDYKVERPAYPFPSDTKLPACPKSPRCPFELRDGVWNCCWCGKTRNTTGRCGCRMVSSHEEYFCEHVCCERCGKGSYAL